MKYYSIIAFASAIVHSVLGISIGCGKLKGFVNIMCKNQKRYKFLGGYFVAIGVIMLSCGFAALYESTASIIYIVVSAVLVSIFISLIRRESI